MATLEHLHKLVDGLPEAERDTAARLLTALTCQTAVPGDSFFADGAPPAVVRPEVEPIEDIDQLRGDFWPHDEGPDDFLHAVRAWRRESADA